MNVFYVSGFESPYLYETNTLSSFTAFKDALTNVMTVPVLLLQTKGIRIFEMIEELIGIS